MNTLLWIAEFIGFLLDLVAGCVYNDGYQEHTPVCLFLDDERNPEDVTWVEYSPSLKFVVVRTYDDFVQYLENNDYPNYISFDHDLGDFGGENNQERTGYTCVKYLCDKFANSTLGMDKFPYCVYHTNNVIGKKNMSMYIQNFREFML